MPKTSKPSKSPQPPKGTRDLYPDDLLKRRYIQNAWRDASLRCGFDEIEGPTFESSDLYSIKSGEGILNELFQTFSGKGGQQTLDKLVENGKADFALRPEFTPTLARMYAARAKQLPKPCKWFTAGPYFRAERPQRGRLREFLQWNVDAIGLPSEDSTPEANSQMDSEVIECCINALSAFGLTSTDCKIKMSNRAFVSEALEQIGVAPVLIGETLDLLDKKSKMPIDKFAQQAEMLGLKPTFQKDFKEKMDDLEFRGPELFKTIRRFFSYSFGKHESIELSKRVGEALDWLESDFSIVRGLAYYTGTVFEAIADGERAVAGGGRYDNLIELMGGPPTPAVGFAMGDVVLTNLLEDNNLIPQGQDLMEAVARPQASIRPQAFIAVPNNDEENKSAAQSLAATLRRGTESEAYLNNDNRKPWQQDRYVIPPLHTRISYKSTTNPGKLKADAARQHAKFYIEFNDPESLELRDMDNRDDYTSKIGSFSADPSSPNFIGTKLNELL